jgi:hypothetical protein
LRPHVPASTSRAATGRPSPARDPSCSRASQRPPVPAFPEIEFTFGAMSADNPLAYAFH